jgi:formylglycine-generating enzyme required for sulfatase activity
MGDNGVSAADMKRAQAAWAKYLGRQVEEEDEIAPGVRMEFVLVPPGRFRMGSPDGEAERGKDEVQHEVELTRPFYLAVNDVTQAQYEAVTGENPSNFKGPDLPVETVRWTEADDFARKLTEKAKGGLLYRLPTEAEWEYSCRGGRSSSLPFGIGDGTSLSSLKANFGGEKTTPVGSYQANALGLYDMQGNVWQWCADYYGDYPTEKVTNPTGPASGSSRVYRGGGWNFSAGLCRAADRSRFAPGDRYCDLGFRVARVPSGLDK